MHAGLIYFVTHFISGPFSLHYCPLPISAVVLSIVSAIKIKEKVSYPKYYFPLILNLVLNSERTLRLRKKKVPIYFRLGHDKTTRSDATQQRIYSRLTIYIVGRELLFKRNIYLATVGINTNLARKA